MLVTIISWGTEYIATTDNLTVLRMYNYVDSFIQGIFTDDGLTSTSSGNRLFNDMYFELTAKQLIIGDAKYTEGSSYYMQTDAGYMRPILFLEFLAYYYYFYYNYIY